MMKTISLIGSTGSIGKQAIEVVKAHPDQFTIQSLVANSSAQTFLEQVRLLKPKYAALADERAGESIKDQIPDGVRFSCGKQAALEGVEYGDIALIAASGFAGLKYSLKAIECGKDIALANKETLVCGGELVMSKIKGAGTRLIPVDSEHSALFQALNFRLDAPFKRLIITASGGPFYGWEQSRLQSVKPIDALKHPTWNMGAKITIDSATLLNKGFEVIEAKWLYNARLDQIHTLVQPESIVHSMVEFADGSVLAQMSYPTMELPIQLALTYPSRLPCNLPSLDFEKLGAIRFLPLNRHDFPCYDLALKAAESGDNYPCALNGAGEVAVQAFLREEIAFTDIARVIDAVLQETERRKITSYADCEQTDAWAREHAWQAVQKIQK